MQTKVRYISESVQLGNGLLDILDCVKSIEDMFCVYRTGDFMMGGENMHSHGLSIRFSRNTDDRENLYIAMPAFLGGRFNCAGIKWHGPNVKGVIETPLGCSETCYTLILNDPDTGRRKAIIPANIITSYRTAAVSVCAAKYLSLENPEILSIIGPGKINLLITEGILKLFPSIKKIKIKGHSDEGVNRYVDLIKKQFPYINIMKCGSIQEAVEYSDIISVNPGFEFDNIKDMPILREKWIKEGALILSMSFIKIPNNMLYNCSYKIVDALKMYENYIDEYGYPSYSHLSILGNSIADAIHIGKVSKEEVFELANVITQDVKIIHDRKPILFASGGLGIEDIAIGVDLLEKAEVNGLGVMLEE
ncbi:ornithine cyclodeaminase [Lachnospiraceae bacterium]|nr:ornithine cyclodeaminase [Lachnospiraceae bacterium]